MTKDPNEYTDFKTQPHAAVANRLNDTGLYHFHHGDIVEYIICEVRLGLFIFESHLNKLELKLIKDLYEQNFFL